MFAIPEFTSQLPLVPDPQLLGPGTKYHHIQQVTENQGFYQIVKSKNLFTKILQKRRTFILGNKKNWGLVHFNFDLDVRLSHSVGSETRFSTFSWPLN